MSSPSDKFLMLTYSWWFCHSDQTLSDTESMPDLVTDAWMNMVRFNPHRDSFLSKLKEKVGEMPKATQVSMAPNLSFMPFSVCHIAW